MKADFFDPAGTRRGFASRTVDVPPNGMIGSGYIPADVPLDREGTWTIIAVLREA